MYRATVKGFEDSVIKTIGRWESATCLWYMKIPRKNCPDSLSTGSLSYLYRYFVSSVLSKRLVGGCAAEVAAWRGLPQHLATATSMARGCVGVGSC